MLNAKNMIKALVVSVALAFLISVGSTVLFGSSVTIAPEADWEKINSMPYLEATNYIQAHSKPVSGWEVFVTYIQWWAFITPTFFALIGCLFIGCVVLLWWAHREKAT